MAHQLSFERLIRYDAGESGITVETTLKLFEKSVSLNAKVDTGATYCIFERKVGLSLGLNIEDGLEQPISTATGRLMTYGHEVTLVLVGLSLILLRTLLLILRCSAMYLAVIGWTESSSVSLTTKASYY